jgi:hypothetical protein
MNDSTPETNPSPSTDGEAALAVPGTETVDIEATLAWVRSRLPTVTRFAGNVHREGYQVPAEDRAALAMIGADLEYALDKAEGYYKGFADLWNRHYAEAEERQAQPDPVDERVERIARYVRTARWLVGAAVALAVVHLVLTIVDVSRIW